MDRDRAGHFAMALFCSLCIIANGKGTTTVEQVAVFVLAGVAALNLYFGLSVKGYKEDK